MAGWGAHRGKGKGLQQHGCERAKPAPGSSAQTAGHPKKAHGILVYRRGLQGGWTNTSLKCSVPPESQIQPRYSPQHY